MLNRTIGRDSYTRLEILHRFGGSLLALIEGMRVFAGFSTARTSAVMLVTSKGAAAVSGDSLVVFAATVTAIGVLPMEGLALAYTVLCPWPLPPATPSETAWRRWWCEVVGGVYRTDCEGRIQPSVRA